eukprot:TRINITY_DN29471_c0_g1_i2.p1 TRINITY_DN29471_c0_g1~~TRINITY_DN29471_c0_g1_i2.p1  ORF type:complete len:381 (+),score=35.69 TRINITY_DN29471_c0_g1_i2:126-1145(+)
MKTHKTLEGARLQCVGSETAEAGLVVSTLSEARFFAAGGYKDITYAVPITPDKIEDALTLMGDVTLRVAIDHEEALEALVHRHHPDYPWSVWLFVDCGGRREGIDPTGDEAITLARRIATSPYTNLFGVYGHSGFSYASHTTEEIQQCAARERDVLVGFANRLRDAGIVCQVVAMGSTPTCSCPPVEGLTGITEIHPGNYIFYDLHQASIGSCTIKECAATVLTRIVSVYPKRRSLLIDAGALALSKDMGATHLHGSDGFSYGAVLGQATLRITRLTQELGTVEGTEETDWDSFHLGDLLRIIPNHSCLTAALFPCYHVIEEGRIIEEWRPDRGWQRSA